MYILHMVIEIMFYFLITQEVYTGWPDTLGPPGIEPFAFVRKLMTVFSYYAIFYDTLTKNL